MAQHASKHARFQAITANRLLDGEVVYFTATGAWATDFAAAEIVEGTAAADALLSKAMADDFESHIIEPYLFEVVKAGAAFLPVSVRETIRAKGPTVRLDLGKQAGA